jgi:hypothetical protein
MSRRVRRRQKKVSDAMNRAIDEAVETFYVATGINTECVRGRLKAHGPDRDADLLVVVDQPRFGAVRTGASEGVRGSARHSVPHVRCERGLTSHNAANIHDRTTPHRQTNFY